MYTLLEGCSALAELSSKMSESWQIIKASLHSSSASAPAPAVIERDAELLSRARQESCLYELEEGLVRTSALDQSLICLEPGDLIGLEQFCPAIPGLPTLTMSSDFAVRAFQYPVSQIMQVLGTNEKLLTHWNSLLTLSSAAWVSLAHHLAARLAACPNQQNPEVRHYEPGQQIIEQGALSREVFTLIEGRAEARVDGVAVGEIATDEIFGAIAAIANVPRTASVVATTRAMALVLPEAHFLQLLQSRPETVIRLIRDMAKALAGVNERLVKQSSQAR